MKRGLALVFFLVIIYVLHLGVTWMSESSREWYQALQMPHWRPSREGLTRIWLSMLIFNGVSGALLWVAPKSKHRTIALCWWFGQFALNESWSILFYVCRHLLLAAIDLAVLFIAVLLTIRAAYKVDKAAAILLIPYEVWLLYANAIFIAIALNN